MLFDILDYVNLLIIFSVCYLGYVSITSFVLENQFRNLAGDFGMSKMENITRKLGNIWFRFCSALESE